MVSEVTGRIGSRFGRQRSLQICAAVVFLVLGVVFALELLIPVGSGMSDGGVGANAGLPGVVESVNFWEPNVSDIASVASLVHPGMFKPSTGVGDRPMADKTIERIKSRLTVQCIMEMNGKMVAYVKVKGEGLYKCMVGESVGDLFTVVDILKRSVVIKIVGHKVTLSL